MSSAIGRIVVDVLTNKSGGSVAYGDVVVLDSANDDAFTTDSAGAYTGIVGVCIEPNGIASNASGRIQTQGPVAQINCNASVTRGNFLKTHTAVKLAASAGTSRVVGTFAKTKNTSATPRAILFGFPDAASASAAAGTPAVTLSTTNGAGAASTYVATDATIAVFDATAPTTQDFGDAAAAGSAGAAARRDHKHAWPRALRGRVNADGTIASGSGFTVTKNATGDYTVNFSVAFSAAPHAFVTAEGSSSTRLMFMFVAPTTSAFRINITTFGGSNTDTPFSFFVIAQ